MYPPADNEEDKDENDPLLPSHAKSTESGDECNRTRILLFILMFSVILMSHLGFSLLGPFFTMEALNKGINEWETGFIFSVYEMSSFGCSLLFGKFLTKIGVKFMIIAGVFTLAVTLSLFGTLMLCSGMTFLTLSIILRVFQGIASAAVDTGVYTIIVNRYEANLSTMMGFMEISYGVADMVGPVIGGILYEAGGFFMPFVVVGGCTCLMGILLWAVLPTQDAEDDDGESGLFALLVIPSIWFGILTIVFNTICITFLDLTLAQHLDQFSLSPSQKGWIFAVASVTEITFAPIIGRLVDRKGYHMSIMMIGALVSGTAMITIGPPPEIMTSYLWMTIFALSFFGIGIAAQLVVPFPFMLGIAKKNGYPNAMQTQALVSGLSAACFPLGSFIGPLAGGYIVENIGFYWSFSLLSAMQFTLGAAFILYFARKGMITCIKTLRHPRNTQENLLNASETEPQHVLCTSSDNLHAGFEGQQ